MLGTKEAWESRVRKAAGAGDFSGRLGEFYEMLGRWNILGTVLVMLITSSTSRVMKLWLLKPFTQAVYIDRAMRLEAADRSVTWDMDAMTLHDSLGVDLECDDVLNSVDFTDFQNMMAEQVAIRTTFLGLTDEVNKDAYIHGLNARLKRVYDLFFRRTPTNRQEVLDRAELMSYIYHIYSITCYKSFTRQLYGTNTIVDDETFYNRLRQ